MQIEYHFANLHGRYKQEIKNIKQNFKHHQSNTSR